MTSRKLKHKGSKVTSTTLHTYTRAYLGRNGEAGAGLDEELNKRKVVACACKIQRCKVHLQPCEQRQRHFLIKKRTHSVIGIDVCAMLEQQGRHMHVAMAACEVQRRQICQAEILTRGVLSHAVSRERKAESGK